VNTDWKKIWETKGIEETDDVRLLNGWEDTCMDPKEAYEGIVGSLEITSNDTILDVGCGAGAVGQYFEPERYAGVDNSPTLLRKHPHSMQALLRHSEASELPFPDNSYDVVFCYSVFHYFDSMTYASRTIAEMRRVSKGRVFVGDLPESSHNRDHLLFKRGDFKEWTITEGYYTPKRFNVFQNEQ